MAAAKDAFTKVLSEAAESTKSKGLLSDNSITLTNLLYSAVVVGLELLLNSEVFDCPLENHVLYGTVFLAAPFFIVFITNVLLIADVWRVTDRTCVGRYRRCGEFGFWVLPDIVKAFVGPCVWLIASFADTDYYVCAEVGQDIEKRNLTNATEIKELEAKFADAKSTSHMLAWLFFSIMVTVTAIVLITKKCCLKENVLLEDNYILERREAIAALTTFRNFMKHPREHADVEKGVARASVPVPSIGASGSGTSTAAGPDKTKDKKKDKDGEIKGRFMGKEEEITIYPDGIPEQRGKKKVEDLFKGWSKYDSWHYRKAYDEFKKMYPRVVTGSAKDPWVSLRVSVAAGVLDVTNLGLLATTISLPDPGPKKEKKKKSRNNIIDPL